MEKELGSDDDGTESRVNHGEGVEVRLPTSPVSVHGCVCTAVSGGVRRLPVCRLFLQSTGTCMEIQ